MVKFVQPINNGDDYYAIALFTPGSHLSKQLLNMMKENWLDYHQKLWQETQSFAASSDKTLAEKIIFIRQYFNEASIRDHLKLQTIAELLLKIKILLEKVGESNAKLNDLIHYTQQTSIEIGENKIPKKFKITS